MGIHRKLRAIHLYSSANPDPLSEVRVRQKQISEKYKLRGNELRKNRKVLI
jgi:hypothetical protein